MATGRRHLGAVDRLPSGRYRLRLTDPATGRRTAAGTFITRADAERALAAAVSALDRGTFVSAQRTITLTDYSAQWLATRLTSNGTRLRPRVRSCTRASSVCTSSRRWDGHR